MSTAATLLDNQVRAIDKLSAYKVGAIFSEPGTGKTRSAIELTKNLNAQRIIWFTPFQNKKNLWSEIIRWASADYVKKCMVVGSDSLSNSDRLFLEMENEIVANYPCCLVLDESLKIKNFEAKRTRRLLHLSRFSEWRLILNGTPLSRNLLDTWAQFEFLSPKILKMSISQFKNTFCEYIKVKKRFGGQSRQYVKEFIVKYHNVDHLYNLIQPYVFEADLSLEVGKQYIDLDFELDEPIMQEYQRLKTEYLDDEKLQWKNNNIFLELTQKMQHIYSLSSEKFTLVDKVLAGTDPGKVLIFRKYLDSDAELRRRYPKVAIKSIQSESLGLNLQDYHTIIIWDKVWDYALVKQMEHRIYRTGQKETCRFINLNGNVNLERLILANLEKKCDLLEYFKSKTHKEGVMEL